MSRKSIFVAIVVLSLLIVVLSLAPGQIMRGNEPVPGHYLPVVANFKVMTPYLVKDINSRTPSSFIYCPQALDEQMLCSAKDQEHGFELWRSDGEEGGASLVKDIVAGGDSYAMKQRRSTARLKGEILFASSYGSELWKTDGSKEGTQLVKDSFSALTSHEPFTVVGDLLYFLGHDAGHGLELWRSDGRSSGTFLLKDIKPGAYGSSISYLTPLGERLYFIAERAQQPNLWVSDGTSPGTKLVDAAAQWPVTHVAPLDDFLILNMHDIPSEPASLWRTDGTTVGTERISDYGTHKGLEPVEFAGLDSQVIFTFRSEDDEDWGIGSSDGTNVGTRLFSITTQTGWEPVDLIAAGSQAFIFERRYPEESCAIWRSDGTNAGTIFLAEFQDECYSSSEEALAVGEKLYFRARDADHGSELWVSDGTPEGTHMVADIAEGEWSAFPRPGVVFKEQLYFSARDSLDDAELWRTDGTVVGTVRADDVFASPSFTSHPGHLIAQPQGIYLSAGRGLEPGLWRSDGTEAGTIQVKSFGRSQGLVFPPGNWAMAEEMLYFIAQLGERWLWRSDGTETGTVMLSGPWECNQPTMPVAVGDKLFFFGHSGGERLCLAGQPHVRVKNLPRPAVDTLATDSLLYFRLDSGKIGVSDGTTAGTMIYDAPILTLGPDYPLAAIGDTAYFNGCTEPATDCELWKLEGPHAAPQRVMDIVPGVGSSDPRGLVALNDALIFTAVGSTFGPLLWRSDGTLSGTWPLFDAVMCGGAQYGSISAVLGGTLFFPGIDVDPSPHDETGSDSDNGCELWVTDGRYQGTRMVRDILPGPNSSIPGALTVAGRHVIFTADDGQHGCELWASDGSGKGTFRISGSEGYQPGPESGSRAGHCPEQLTVSQGKLYFSDYDSLGDNELWALLLAGQ